MSVLAIDSGLERVGYAVFEDKPHPGKPPVYVNSGLVQTGARLAIAERLASVHNQISALVEEYNPSVVVLEKLFFFRNQKTVIEVAQAQGVILALVALRGIPTEYLTPLQIKEIVTGYGAADKKSVQKMLKLQLGLSDDILKQDDRADAIACGLAYCLLNKSLVR